MNRKLKVLFLCTGNSCRSQMAEGWARHLKSDSIEAYSAGVEPHGMNQSAVNVMAEAGVNIVTQTSKHVDSLAHVPFDYVVTVCGHANETCPIFPGKAKVIHVGFDDPPALAKTATSAEEALGHYRRVRDEIEAWIRTLPESLQRTTLAAPRDKSKSGILVMCVGNSARSQMAEGFLRARAGDLYDVHSAGMNPKEEVHPMAVRVMNEIGIDIGKQWPKSTRAYLGRAWFQHVIVVCETTEQNCPRIFIGATHRLLWPIHDPLAVHGSQEQQLAAFRNARDQIDTHVKEWVKTLRQGSTTS
jgi:arsenate reductase (thioredoxin)